ncbi:SDR family mycofactocin-dependent oxidoreductase [Geodermatophilus dictyosporus]|uniref:SDR family mycofactocin-dependent oxidoreductase n=1 Tax=Geodermatophilus dictyosporus TaxID=1523247 RepID=A0A1I5QUA6_9ACTN|nr:mycofactocin-coupled SDR family oxidoreductase [Geodermatophilus dictyosporus]SFP49426.1 SDR family mycofactocin-dependent oxidoreductase [Geodermatophilus dictyosporus]
MSRLQGKVVLVTGAARGQGRAHAVAFAREGADVVAVDIDSDTDGGVDSVPYPTARAADLAETAAQVEALDRRIVARTADVRDAAALEAAVAEGLETLGRIDALVANAGVFSQAPFWEMGEQQFRDVLEINLLGVWRSMKAVAPHMIERRSGSMVLISSVNGVRGNAGAAHYAASKHGVLGLMRSAALELGPHRVRVNAICPGLVDTPMVNWPGMYDQMAGRPGGTREDFDASALHYGVLGGQGGLPPETVADAAVWLASDGAWAVTGQAIPVDAGHLALPGFNPAPVQPVPDRP